MADTSHNWRSITLIAQGTVFWVGAVVLSWAALMMTPYRQMLPSGAHCSEGEGIVSMMIAMSAVTLAGVSVVVAGVDLVLKFRLRNVAVATLLPGLIVVVMSIGSYIYTCGTE